MKKELIFNDIRKNKLTTSVTCFFMAMTAMLMGVTVLLFSSLSGSVDELMSRAGTPDFLQMHTGEINETEIETFAESQESVQDWQIARFLNLENGMLSLGDHSLSDSTQDNGLCVQSERFDFLLTQDNELPQVLPGEVYVPVCYQLQYDLHEGEIMQIGEKELKIVGFIRDSQMNSMMASSKRFLVCEEDYREFLDMGVEEYLIEFETVPDADVNELTTAYAKAGLPNNGPAITGPLIKLMNALSDGIMVFIILMVSIVVLMISVLCIRFILLTRMYREKREVGILKALGISEKEILGIYYGKYLFLAGIGSVMGFAAAFFLQKPLSSEMRKLYGGSESNLLTLVVTILAIACMEFILLMTIKRAIKKVLGLTALDALYGNTVERKKISKQFMLTGVVVALCTFLMLLPQNIYSTLSAPEFVTYMGIGNAPIRFDIRMDDEIEEKTTALEGNLKEDERVADYVILQTKSYTAYLPDGTETSLMVEQGDHSVFPLQYASGKLPAEDHDIALSALKAEELQVSVGDSITILVNGIPAEYAVCGIYSDVTNGGKTAKSCVIDDEQPVMWSLMYASLAEDADEGVWIAEYLDLFDCMDGGRIEEYVKGTYGQTIEQVERAKSIAVLVAVSIIFVVLVLFVRMLIEKDRYDISLKKAIGFTSAAISGEYMKRVSVCILIGVLMGLFLGCVPGEAIAGMLLGSLGAAGFEFIFDHIQICLVIPVIAVATALVAAWIGVREIKHMKANECLTGKE